jgi:hypothetical protein
VVAWLCGTRAEALEALGLWLCSRDSERPWTRMQWNCSASWWSDVELDRILNRELRAMRPAEVTSSRS